MPAEYVVDASLMGAAFFQEAATPVARRFLERGPLLVAPDALWTQMASLAAKRMARGEATLEVAERAIDALSEFVGESASIRPLARPALVLAATHGFSARDAIYLALAERVGIPLATLDSRLVGQATAAGFERLIFIPT